MTQITAYTYDADYHCVECTSEEFSPSLPEYAAMGEGSTDANHVPFNIKDYHGNPIHPIFSTDELPTRLGDTFGDEMRWYEPQEFYTCGTCRQQFSLLTGVLKCTSK